ncbi:MAG: hypothetical protein OWU33_14540 [Firmicutes bacterium]|nr:hypothetical protein [Bacillota bacterium]
MDQRDWTQMLQDFWANGYDLALGTREGWLTHTMLAQASPEWLLGPFNSVPRLEAFVYSLHLINPYTKATQKNGGRTS